MYQRRVSCKRRLLRRADAPRGRGLKGASQRRFAPFADGFGAWIVRAFGVGTTSARRAGRTEVGAARLGGGAAVAFGSVVRDGGVGVGDAERIEDAPFERLHAFGLRIVFVIVAE